MSVLGAWLTRRKIVIADSIMAHGDSREDARQKEPRRSRKMKQVRQFCEAALLVVFCGVNITCSGLATSGGGIRGSAPPPPPSITVTISPSEVEGGQTATVTVTF